MGVKGLLGFIENCPEAFKDVSIEKMAKDYQHLHGCRPILAVDGSNFITSFYAYRDDSLECIYGGQWIQFREVLKEIVSKFESKGIKLVFIFDGTICEEKLKAWANRRMDKYEEIAEIFDDIYQNLQKKVISSEHVSPAFKLLAKYALKELGVDMLQTDREMDADNYIADYANKNKEVFAILSDDSDFIIFDTKPMLSTSNLNLKKFTTVMYDRDFIAKHYLHISRRWLPLFACLMGNDHVPFDDLKPFHRRLANGERNYKVAKVQNLCALIKKRNWTGDFNNERELSLISIEAFGHQNRNDLIKRGLESYVIDNAAKPLTLYMRMRLDFKEAVHERHFNCSNSYIYNILCKKKYVSPEAFEDGSKSPSALVYREIRQRCYGLLFNCYVEPDRANSTVVEERCWYRKNKYENNDLNKPEGIRPLPLPNTIQVLEDGARFPSALVYREIRQRCYGLLFNCFVEPGSVKSIIIEERCWYKKNQNEKNDLNEPERISPLPLRNISDIIKIEDLWFNCAEERRFKFFWNILQIPMEFDVLKTLPEDQLALSCILNYLIVGRKSDPLLEPLDVAVFVAQAAWKPRSDDIKGLRNPKVVATAVNLSTLFINGIEPILMALETCGFPEPYKYALPWRFFDGKLFHFLYNEAKRLPRVRVLCNGQDEITERFYQLLSVVTNCTAYDPKRFEWRSVLEDFEVEQKTKS